MEWILYYTGSRGGGHPSAEKSSDPGGASETRGGLSQQRVGIRDSGSVQNIGPVKTDLRQRRDEIWPDFFDEFGKKVADAASDLSRKAGDTIEVQKLKSEIRFLKRGNQRDFVDIGKSIYEKFTKMRYRIWI